MCVNFCLHSFMDTMKNRISRIYSETKEHERNDLIFLKLLVKPHEKSWPHLQECSSIGLLTWSTWNNCLKHLMQRLDSPAELPGCWSNNVTANNILFFFKVICNVKKENSARILGARDCCAWVVVHPGSWEDNIELWWNGKPQISAF